MMAGMYRQLDAQKLFETTRGFADRIAAEFPGSGLAQVGHEVTRVADDAVRITARISRPMWGLRIASFILTFALVAGIVLGILAAIRASRAQVRVDVSDASNFAQGIESAINDVIFAGIAVWFAFSIETRIKRRRALALIGQLRSLAHVIDLHQLAKDPHATPGPAPDKAEPKLGGAALALYLDYCSDLLSLLAKLAALCAHRFNDGVTLAAVKELEDLTNGLSRKFWQKIMIIDRVAGHARLAPLQAGAAPPPTPSSPS